MAYDYSQLTDSEIEWALKRFVDADEKRRALHRSRTSNKAVYISIFILLFLVGLYIFFIIFAGAVISGETTDFDLIILLFLFIFYLVFSFFIIVRIFKKPKYYSESDSYHSLEIEAKKRGIEP